MTLTLAVEERKEYKLLASEKNVAEFLYKNKDELVTLFPKRTIKSLYFDTLNFELYEKSNLNDVEKFKIRVRTYSNNSKFFEEIKSNLFLGKKKKVTELSINDFKEVSEIYYKGVVYFPAVYTQYKRSYYKFNEARVTIDEDIKFISHNFRTKLKNLYSTNVAAKKFYRSINIIKKYYNNVIEYKNLEGFSDVEKYIEKNPIAFSKYNTAVRKVYKFK